MRYSCEEIPVETELGEINIRAFEGGDVYARYIDLPAGTDFTPLLAGLPDDRCQCPHWGYVLKGRMRIRYPDREEVIEAGDTYYMAPGHLPLFEEDTEVVEFSPKGEYQRTLEVVARNMAAMEEGQ